MFGIGKLSYDERAILFADAYKAREFVEQVRWPDGPICPHCGVEGNAYALTKRKSGAKTRKGLYKCADCRKQFTVTVGTIFEGSRVGLHKWLKAIYAMCSSKKGVSAKQLERELGVQYKTAWFMCHRVRKAMEKIPAGKIGGPRNDGGKKVAGQVEVDETYVGGKRRRLGAPVSKKTIVVSLIDRHGDSRSFVADNTKAKTLKGLIRRNVHGITHILTDEHASYKGLHREFSGHGTVNHSAKEYVRGVVSTNFAESFFSLLKRGIIGTFHHVSEKHMQRYLEEFDFRWNSRKTTDDERMVAAIKASEGKRLMYRAPIGGEASTP